ncbi:MAG TPA: peptidoglycan-binding protein [Thermoleophilaceae bacterium]|nr:peptidoglycan-binding protein [Thermoleophilaceae bacterium]
MGRIAFVFLGVALAATLLTAPAAQARSADAAALQVALKGVRAYGGPVDGIAGPATRRAVRRFQRRHRLAADGVAGPRTRRALGRRGRPRLGSRTLRVGRRGWDVAALQYLLRRRGARPGGVDGGFGRATAAAVRRYQRRAGLGVDGIAGPATIRAVQRGVRRRTVRRVSSGMGQLGGPVLFFRPVRGPLGDGFGMRWGRQHQGIDFPVAGGTRVGAAGRGVVRFAGWNTGGYGNLVIIQHRLGFQTWYAHLSRETSYPGEVVTGGTRIGYVGSTGHSTGPHLHFEVRLNGKPINPMPRLLGRAAGRWRHRGCDPAELRRKPLSGGTSADPC